jgi:hypothetical protein
VYRQEAFASSLRLRLRLRRPDFIGTRLISLHIYESQFVAKTRAHAADRASAPDRYGPGNCIRDVSGIRLVRRFTNRFRGNACCGAAVRLVAGYASRG